MAVAPSFRNACLLHSMIQAEGTCHSYGRGKKRNLQWFLMFLIRLGLNHFHQLKQFICPSLVLVIFGSTLLLQKNAVSQRAKVGNVEFSCREEE